MRRVGIAFVFQLLVIIPSVHVFGEQETNQLLNQLLPAASPLPPSSWSPPNYKTNRESFIFSGTNGDASVQTSNLILSYNLEQNSDSPARSAIGLIQMDLEKTNLDMNTRHRLEIMLTQLQELADHKQQVQNVQVQSNMASALAKAGNPLLIAAPQVPGSTWLLQASTNFDLSDTNLNAGGPASNAVPHDAMDAWLLQTIDKNKRDLQTPGLDAVSRQFLQRSLRRLYGQWNNHQAQVQNNKAFVETMHSNPKTALTNMPDPIEQSWSLAIAQKERELADTTLDPYRRQALEAIVATLKQQLADHTTNAQLWANLHQAQQSKDAETKAYAERELADYLEANLGKIQGKKYPPGMSLDAIMAEYQKQGNGSHWFNSRTAIRAIILTVFLLPPLVMIFMAIKKRVSK